MASESVSERVLYAASAKSPCGQTVSLGSLAPKNILVQAEVRPQINPAHVLVGGQRIGRAASKNCTIVHDICPVSNAHRLTYVVVGDQKADAARLQVKDDLLDIGHRDRIDPGERFVEKHETR